MYRNITLTQKDQIHQFKIVCKNILFILRTMYLDEWDCEFSTKETHLLFEMEIYRG